MGAQQFAPDKLRQLVEDYDVAYSTHTYGPHCRDAEGRLRSLTDCNNAPPEGLWDQSVEDYTYPEVIDYVRALHDLISEASGTTVTDHNGNWEFAQASRFAEIPMLTWSAYKNHTDQHTYDVLINNPWRPKEANPDANTEAFLTHDPTTQIVYIPGWSQTITRHPESVPERMPPLVSQFIRFADPERVNSFCVVLHIDHFYPRSGDPDYIVYDQATGEFSYSAEFQQHLLYVDDMLTELIDPLVAEGYLQWSSLPEIGKLYIEWEEACGLSAEPAPEEAPAAPPASQGRCGDGTCNAPENAQNFPQDCGGAPAPTMIAPQGAAALPSAGSPDYEPPINVFLLLHIDPGKTTDEEPTFQATPTIYQRTYDQIEWLVEEAARHDLRFTSLYNGWYPKWALDSGGLSQFQALLDAGHDIGTHAHRLTYDPETDLWMARVHELSGYGYPNYDHDLARESWEDADRYVDAVLDELGVTGQNQMMASLAFKCSTQGDLLEEFGFRYSCGSRAEKAVSYFGHIVWNPWRPSASDEPGHELEEDLSRDFIVMDHLAHVGVVGGAHRMDLSIPQMKRRFLMLCLEWLSRERRGVEDRVWTFGFVFHPEDGDTFNDGLTDFLTWLDENFVGQTSHHGNQIARCATVTDIAEEYELWEVKLPGTSSFSYLLDDPTPYTYALVPEILDGAAYEAAVNLGPGLNCHQLSRDGQPVYVLWLEEGERRIDFSGQLAGQVSVTDATGQQSQQDASALLVTEEPLFFQPWG